MKNNSNGIGFIKARIFLFCIIISLTTQFSFAWADDLKLIKKNTTATPLSLDSYYQLKDTDTQAAKNILLAIIQTDPRNIAAQKEMAYLLLRNKESKAALSYFETAAVLDPKDYQLQMQIGYLLNQLGNNQDAITYFKNASLASDTKIRLASLKAIQTLQNTNTANPLDEFYRLKKANECAAENYLAAYLSTNPCDITAQREMAYLLLKQKREAEALYHFQIVQQLNPCDYKIALQIAYLLADLKLHREAYLQFNYATNSPNVEDRKTAYQSMLNIAGLTTKVLPDPFFAEVYGNPFYLDRFNDSIMPAQFRLGVTYGPKQQGAVYGVIYYNRDTQSRGGIAPAIYNDNSITYDAGTRYKPFDKIPIYVYFEAGRAYNLINRGLGSYQSDVRGGVFGFDAWGVKPVFAECAEFPFKQFGTVYGNFSFYSRYQHDWIGQLTVREGIRIFRYQNSSIDIYLKGQCFWDTKQYFYNNVVEVGPGIAFVPNNRIGLTIRAELVRGYYIPVNSPDPNPYNPTYNANNVQLETYWRF